MKKIIFIITLLLFIGNVYSEEKLRVAVLKFAISDDQEPELAETITDNFIISLINLKKYNIVEREKLQDALTELEIQHSDDFDEEYAREIGKLAGAQVVIIGNIRKIDEIYNIIIRGIQVENGIVLFGTKETVGSKKELLQSIDKIALNIVRPPHFMIGPFSFQSDKLTKPQEIFYRNYFIGSWNFDINLSGDKYKVQLKGKRYIAGGLFGNVIKSV